MAHDVFISHSAKDKATGDAVCAMLESNGVRCWIAPRDVTPGMEWGECIVEAIEQSRIMILVFTTHANESPQIRHEVERAVNYGVAILPVRIEDVVPGRALEYFIGNVHWLDALTPPLETHLKSLAGTVKILLARMPLRGVMSPATPIPPPEPPLREPPPPRPGLTESIKGEMAELRWEVASPNASAPESAPPVPPAPPNPIPTAIPQNWPGAAPPNPFPATPHQSAEAPGYYAFPPPPPPPFPAGFAAVGTRKKPIGLIIVTVLTFLEAGFWIWGLSQDLSRDRFEIVDFVALVYAAVDIATGYGLLKIKVWGRILRMVTAAINLVLMIIPLFTVSSNDRDATFWAIWLALFAYSGLNLWLMSKTQVKQAFKRQS
jgi:hypothetical protein